MKKRRKGRREGKKLLPLDRNPGIALAATGGVREEGEGEGGGRTKREGQEKKL